MKEQVLSDKQRRAKRIYGIVGIALTILCIILSYFYRPYAYSHHLNDFHLADSYTSFFGVPIIVCLTQAFFRKESEKWSIPKNIVYAVLMLSCGRPLMVFLPKGWTGWTSQQVPLADAILISFICFSASSILGDIKNERHKKNFLLFFLHYTCIFRDNLYLCKIITVIIIMTIIISGYEVL